MMNVVEMIALPLRRVVSLFRAPVYYHHHHHHHHHYYYYYYYYYYYA